MPATRLVNAMTIAFDREGSANLEMRASNLPPAYFKSAGLLMKALYQSLKLPLLSGIVSGVLAGLGSAYFIPMTPGQVGSTVLQLVAIIIASGTAVGIAVWLFLESQKP
ncbi:MAG: hypothetical protein ACLP8A_17895 [Methylovirgula sp.]